MSELASSMIPAPLQVVSARRESADVVTLTLDAAAQPHAFEPGQFNMLYAFGVGEAAISMSGEPANPELIVHTIRSVGAVSAALSKLGPGDVLGVRGPFGAPWPMNRAKGNDLVLLAGGLGLAPLRPAVYHALAHRADYRRVFLLAGARSPSDLLFREELARWQQSQQITTLVTVDHANQDWKGLVGVAPALLARIELEPLRTVAFVCGPELMMRFSVRELLRRGIAEERIYLSMERNMKCALGFCGHCQYRESFICKDGPVLSYQRIQPLFWLKEA
jgi:NAD(P)H-flavin reductase